MIVGELADLYGTVRIDGASVNAALDSIKQKLGDTKSKMDSLESSLVNWGKSFLSIAAVIGAAKTGFGEIMGDERAATQLAGVLRATGNAALGSAQDLIAYARQLQDLTGIQDDATVAAMSLLATHDNIGGPVFREAIALAQDMSIIYGDLGSTAQALGKALEDPIEGVALLERIMKTKLDPALRDNIAALANMGDTAGAQALILDFVRGKVGGLAQAAGQDAAGQFEKLKRAWEDLASSAAKPLTFVINVVTKGLEFLKSPFTLFEKADEAFAAKMELWKSTIIRGIAEAKTPEERERIVAAATAKTASWGGLFTREQLAPLVPRGSFAGQEEILARLDEEARAKWAATRPAVDEGTQKSPEPFVGTPSEADVELRYRDELDKKKAREKEHDAAMHALQDDEDRMLEADKSNERFLEKEWEEKWANQEEHFAYQQRLDDIMVEYAQNFAKDLDRQATTEKRIDKALDDFFEPIEKQRMRRAEMTPMSVESYVESLQRGVSREEEVPRKLDRTNELLEAIRKGVVEWAVTT